MSAPAPDALFAALDATWPPARSERVGPWRIRDGAGGGKRVSSASAEAPVGPDDIAQAEAAMRRLGQAPLFRIRKGEGALDGLLAARGYKVVDPVNILAAPVAPLAARELPRLSAFAMPEPLEIMKEIWAAGGIGPARLAVMARAPSPKAAILGRTEDRAAAAAFVAASGRIAMLHALEVLPGFRRKGTARNVMTQAARWAGAAGADWLAVAVTRANAAGNALYASLGMAVVENYHYRQPTNRISP